MNKDQFNFTYTAPSQEERREIESIRRQYTNQPIENENKFERLKKLDGLVRNTATVWALVLGIIGTLIFGLGFSMVLEWNIVLWGIVVCAVGAIPIAIAYPVYLLVFKKLKKKYGEEILKLSEELLNDKTE